MSRLAIEANVPSGIEDTLVEEPAAGEVRATTGRKRPRGQKAHAHKPGMEKGFHGVFLG